MERLSMTVTVEHPHMGQFFAVLLKMRRSSALRSPSESAGLRILLRCAFHSL